MRGSRYYRPPIFDPEARERFLRLRKHARSERTQIALLPPDIEMIDFDKMIEKLMAVTKDE